MFVSNSFCLADLEMRIMPDAPRPDVESPRKRPAASLPENVARAACLPSDKSSPFDGTLVAECVAVNAQRLGDPAAKELMANLLSRTWTTSGACSGTGMAEVDGPRRS